MPVVAGIFYPSDACECRSLAEQLLHVNEAAVTAAQAERNWLGGIVPHAGWICSGAIAGTTIALLSRQHENVDVVVVFGAIHTPLHTDQAALDTHEKWHVPVGHCEISRELSSRLIESGSSLFAVDERFHRREHAVEVELPLIHVAWPDAAVVPVEVPAVEHAAEIGRSVARRVAQAGLKAVFLASSDLTHYGPHYDFVPAGLGNDALAWAKENDRRLLRLVTDMTVESVVREVREHHNACGGGAIAAMMAACREFGAEAGKVLHHANSYETLARLQPQLPHNAVGYASVVVG